MNSTAARDSLREMLETHEVAPLPAFDVDGSLIAPNDYRTKLERATMWVEFYLEHRVTEGQGHSLRGVISHIRVVDPPASRPESDSRQDLMAVDERELVW